VEQREAANLGEVLVEKRVTLRDVAKRLGVSTGTVSRALQDHPALNPITKARVLQMANSLGYRPNLAARFLSSRRRLVIGVNTPRDPAFFYDQVRKGIDQESAPFQMTGVEVQHRMFPRVGVGEEEAFESALDAKVDGLIVVPGGSRSLKSCIRRASQMKIPVVCLISDVTAARKLVSVSVDASASGALAAELMGRFLVGKGQVAVTSGDLTVSDHRGKCTAFERTIRAQFPAMELFPPIENHDSECEAYEKTLRLIDSHPDIDAVYISTGNGLPVLQALEERNLFGKITVLSTDLYPELIEKIQEGAVAGSMYQRPATQARIAFRLLYEFLYEGACPPARVTLAPLLVMRGNLNCFHGEDPR
jgi:LacI family transcriptional regulator